MKVYVVLAYEVMCEIGENVRINRIYAYNSGIFTSHYQVRSGEKGERKVIATKTISAKTYSGY